MIRTYTPSEALALTLRRAQIGEFFGEAPVRCIGETFIQPYGAVSRGDVRSDIEMVLSRPFGRYAVVLWAAEGERCCCNGEKKQPGRKCPFCKGAGACVEVKAVGPGVTREEADPTPAVCFVCEGEGTLGDTCECDGSGYLRKPADLLDHLRIPAWQGAAVLEASVDRLRRGLGPIRDTMSPWSSPIDGWQARSALWTPRVQADIYHNDSIWTGPPTSVPRNGRATGQAARDACDATLTSAGYALLDGTGDEQTITLDDGAVS